MNMEDNQNTRVASLIYFADHVQKERAEKWVAKLIEQGHAVAATTREYDATYGDPCWYIP
jgi:hypothetical protein